MSEIALKKYIRLNIIEKRMLIDEFTTLLEKIKELSIFPTPIYQILLEQNQENLIELLVAESRVEEKLSDLKEAESNSYKKNVTTYTFLRNITQNQTIFEFDILELTEVNNYQKYIAKNLKILMIIKYSFIFYEFYNKFYKDLEEKINENLDENKIGDFEDVKNQLLDLDYTSYETFLSNTFPLEEDFDLKDLIIPLDEDEKLNEFKLSLHNFDPNNFDLNDEDFYYKLIDIYIDPRIELIINSFKTILEEIINKLNQLTETTIQITELPYSNYFVFMINAKKSTGVSDWILSDFIEKLNLEDMSEEQSSQINNSQENEEIAEIENISTTLDENNYALIKPFIRIHNWIINKFEQLENIKITKYSDFIKKKIGENYLNKVNDTFRKNIKEYLEHSIKSHTQLIKIPNFPMMISEDLLNFATIESEDTIIQYFEKLNSSISKLNEIITNNSINSWIKGYIIEQHFIKPWISYINSVVYLKEQGIVPNLENSENIEFWEELTELINNETKISSISIADSYLETLYDNYSNSEEIFRFYLIIDELDFLVGKMSEFRKLVYKQIDNLFQQSTIASNEEKQIISWIINNKLFLLNEKRYVDALSNLQDKNILKKISMYILGI